MRMISATVAVLLLAIGSPWCAWAGYDDGAAAYKRGDYEAALREFRLLAEHGDAAAQRFLGGMYLFGRGVPQSGAEAANWYRKAAEQDDPKAEYRIGTMYHAGRGVPQDDVVAQMWLNLAASHGHKRCIRWRNALAKRMTSAQVTEAQRLAREWMAKFEARKK